MKMAFIRSISLLLIISCLHSALTQSYSSSKSRLNAHIIQDSRDLPQVDGAFGFLYRTEDGIAHGAIGEPGGVVHGRYTYTDPTGLKVNFNYNAGSRTSPGYTDNKQQAPSRPSQPAYQPQAAPQPRPRPRPQPQPQPVYEYDEEPQPQPQYRPQPQPQYRPQPQPQYRPQPRPRPSQLEYDIPEPQHRLQPRPRPSQPRHSRPPAPNNLDYGSYTETF